MAITWPTAVYLAYARYPGCVCHVARCVRAVNRHRRHMFAACFHPSGSLNAACFSSTDGRAHASRSRPTKSKNNLRLCLVLHMTTLPPFPPCINVEEIVFLVWFPHRLFYG